MTLKVQPIIDKDVSIKGTYHASNYIMVDLDKEEIDAYFDDDKRILKVEILNEDYNVFVFETAALALYVSNGAV